MFPDIIREDIFRLETRRLWLRWPVLADAGDAAGFLGSDSTPESTSGDPFAARPVAAEVPAAAAILAELARRQRCRDRSFARPDRERSRPAQHRRRQPRAGARQHRPMRPAAAGLARFPSRRTGARDRSRSGHGGHRLHADRDPARRGLVACARSRLPPRAREMRLYVLRNGPRPCTRWTRSCGVGPFPSRPQGLGQPQELAGPWDRARPGASHPACSLLLSVFPVPACRDGHELP